MKYLYWYLYKRHVYANQAKRLPEHSKIHSVYTYLATHYIKTLPTIEIKEQQ